MSSPTAVAEENVGEENRPIGSIGSLTRCSMTKNAAPATANTARPVATTGEVQPAGPASIRATVSPARLTVRVVCPAGSVPWGRRGGQEPGGEEQTGDANRDVHEEYGTPPASRHQRPTHDRACTGGDTGHRTPEILKARRRAAWLG